MYPDAPVTATTWWGAVMPGNRRRGPPGPPGLGCPARSGWVRASTPRQSPDLNDGLAGTRRPGPVR